MNLEEKQLRLRFSLTKGLGSRSFLAVLQQYGSIKDFAEDKGFLPYNITPEYEALVESTDPDTYLVFGEQEYPFLLSQIYDPPIALFCYGNKKLLTQNAISIVGTRKTTEYGKKVVREAVEAFTKLGFVIVSGMAYGTDSIAHEVTLKNNGDTIAVLANDPHIATPHAMYNLHKAIIQNNGLVISENLQEVPNKGGFVMRNRIIAGLTSYTLVVEAPVRSGALITGNLAFDYNREVFAVPGRIHDLQSSGCNNLIKNNKAKLFSDIRDILPEVSILLERDASMDLNKIQRKIVNLLSIERQDLDSIIEQLDLLPREVIQELAQLEIEKKVAKDLIGKYTLC